MLREELEAWGIDILRRAAQKATSKQILRTEKLQDNVLNSGLSMPPPEPVLSFQNKSSQPPEDALEKQSDVIINDGLPQLKLATANSN